MTVTSSASPSKPASARAGAGHGPDVGDESLVVRYLVDVLQRGDAT